VQRCRSKGLDRLLPSLDARNRGRIVLRSPFYRKPFVRRGVLLAMGARPD
jgi:hypothetical protein